MKEISEKLWLAVDFQSGYNGYGGPQFRRSMELGHRTSARFLGYDIYNDKDLFKPTFTFQVDINTF